MKIKVSIIRKEFGNHSQVALHIMILEGLGRYCFHAQLSVAPLKHSAGRRTICRSRRFPRSTERGSIEAGDSRRNRPRAAGFHAQLSVAPLKFIGEPDKPPTDRWFPRSTERGSIEVMTFALFPNLS